MAIERALLDRLLAGRDPQDPFAKDGLVAELKKALSERLLNAELDEHLIGEAGRGVGNHRNGASQKTMLTTGWQVNAKQSPRSGHVDGDAGHPAGP